VKSSSGFREQRYVIQTNLKIGDLFGLLKWHWLIEILWDSECF
jgi:hypothetical protein